MFSSYLWCSVPKSKESKPNNHAKIFVKVVLVLNFKLHKGIILNSLVWWIFVSKLDDDLMSLKSALYLNLKYCLKYVQEYKRKIKTENHKIEHSSHIFPQWMVLWIIVTRFFLPAIDSRQGRKILEVGWHIDWYWESPLYWPILPKKHWKIRYQIKPYQLTAGTQLCELSFIL